MKGAIKNLEDNFNGIRVGRANPRVLDKITVDYYGVESLLIKLQISKFLKLE